MGWVVCYLLVYPAVISALIWRGFISINANGIVVGIVAGIVVGM